jgi:hypothetical protein
MRAARLDTPLSNSSQQGRSCHGLCNLRPELMTCRIARASLGAMSTERDVDTFLTFLMDTFMETAPPAPVQQTVSFPRDSFMGMTPIATPRSPFMGDSFVETRSFAPEPQPTYTNGGFIPAGTPAVGAKAAMIRETIVETIGPAPITVLKPSPLRESFDLGGGKPGTAPKKGHVPRDSVFEPISPGTIVPIVNGDFHVDNSFSDEAPAVELPFRNGVAQEQQQPALVGS